MLSALSRKPVYGGSFRNTTVNGQITGFGLDLGVIDDPMKGRAESKEARAEPFAAQVQGSNVYLAAGPWYHEYIGELEVTGK